jgi:protein TonB
LASTGIQAGIADRLSSTLFVAALAHGVVILGITFTTDPLPAGDSLIPLNVTLLIDSGATESDERHELLAERDHEGAGSLDDEGHRPTRALTADQPLARLGDPTGGDLDDGTPRERAPSPEQLVTQRPSSTRVDVLPDTTETPTPLPMKAATLIPELAPQTLATELDAEAALPPSETPADISSPSASESALAAYLVGWRQRVERIGTANFPDRFLERGSHFGRPTLEVAIGPRGNLEEIVVRRSSGNGSLDQAALKILRMAAPFEPLPPTITAEYKVLRFAYEWDFSTGDRIAAGPAARNQ